MTTSDDGNKRIAGANDIENNIMIMGADGSQQRANEAAAKNDDKDADCSITTTIREDKVHEEQMLPEKMNLVEEVVTAK